MIAGPVNRGLATLTPEKVRAGGKPPGGMHLHAPDEDDAERESTRVSMGSLRLYGGRWNGDEENKRTSFS